MATILPQLIAIDMESVLFAKKETTPATEIKPTTADQVLIAGNGTIQQELSFLPDQQRRNSYSEVGDIVSRYQPGSLNFPVYIKPSGALGTKPECAPFLENLFGREVVTASTKVEYFLQRTSDPIITHTVWFKQGHLVLRAIGVVMSEGRFPLSAGDEDSAIGQVALTGSFANLLWTGTDELAVATAAPDTTIEVKDARKFTAGSYIEIGAQTNSGAGFQVTAVNVGTNVLTITPAVGAIVAVDALVKPWIPVGTEVGTPVHGRFGTATRGGTALRVINAEMILRNNYKWLNNEKNGLSYPDRVIRASKRQVEVNFEVLMDANATKFFYDAQQGTKADVVMPVGATAAQRFTLTAKNVRLSSPAISGTEEKTTPLSGRAFASTALDDELTLLFN